MKTDFKTFPKNTTILCPMKLFKLKRRTASTLCMIIYTANPQTHQGYLVLVQDISNSKFMSVMVTMSLRWYDTNFDLCFVAKIWYYCNASKPLNHCFMCSFGSLVQLSTIFPQYTTKLLKKFAMTRTAIRLRALKNDLKKYRPTHRSLKKRIEYMYWIY